LSDSGFLRTPLAFCVLRENDPVALIASNGGGPSQLELGRPVVAVTEPGSFDGQGNFLRVHPCNPCNPWLKVFPLETSDHVKRIVPAPV
jgi:hypothetical protein